MSGRGRYSRDDLIRSDDLPRKPGKIIRLPGRLDDESERDKWLQQLSNPNVPKILDLFCGAGGMSEGFVEHGFVVSVACDYDAEACKTFEANIPARVVCKDIKNIQDPQSLLDELPCQTIDVIIGGPPCQGFSIYGQGRISSLEEDNQRNLLARNNLYRDFFRFVEHFLPSFFVMENVPRLLTFQNQAYLNAIKLECERLGYDITTEKIDATDYGVPQNRKRLFIIGNRVAKLFSWPYPSYRLQPVTLQQAIGDLPEVLPPCEEESQPYISLQSQSKYQKSMREKVLPEDESFIYDHVVRPVRQDDEHIFKHMKPGDRYIDIDERYRRYNSASFFDKYHMLSPDKPGTTITAHIEKDGYRYIHWDNNQYRTISVREAARIQSFGDHFRFAGSRSSRFRQIGNAVPPLLASIIAKRIYSILKNPDGAPDMQMSLPHQGKVDRVVPLLEIITSQKSEMPTFIHNKHFNKPQQIKLWEATAEEE